MSHLQRYMIYDQNRGRFNGLSKLALKNLLLVLKNLLEIRVNRILNASRINLALKLTVHAS